MDPATPSTVYAIDLSGRLFKSIDSGRTWTVRGSVTGVNFVTVDPTNSSTIYAATGRGLFKSIDGGENWAAADSGLAGFLYHATIAVDPLTPATLYATNTQGIFKSVDAARSWNRLDTLPLEAYAVPHNPYYFQGGITIDPVSPLTIYVDFRGPDFQQGILKSTDGGESWNRLHNAPDILLHSVVVDPITSFTLYALSSKADGRIFKSTDGGETWTVHFAAPQVASVSSLALDPMSPSTVYAVYWSYSGDGEWGILKSTDSGENWSVLNTGLNPLATGFPLLAVSPTTPATVYTGYFVGGLQRPSGHLMKSTDAGNTWNAADAGLTYIDVHAVAVDPAIQTRIYAGMGGTTSAIPLFKSADAGASWSSFAQFELGGPESYCWIAFLLVDSASSNLIYAATNGTNDYGTVFKTTDGGAKWTGTGLRTWYATVMASGAAGSKTVFLGDFDPTGDGEAWLDMSVDGGSNWTEPFEWDIGPVNALVIDPTNPATLYAGTPEGVFQSADGGASWINIGLRMGVTSLALDPGDTSTIYAAAGNFSMGFLGLFKSTDGGASWAPINNGLAGVLDSRSSVTAIAFAPENSSTVYLATSGRGVYKSLDGGADWEPLNEGLTNLDVRLLAVDSALYAVTSSGIFKATN
jgi:photosystem II stability/assembly factor-like uncharacterized protein